MKAIEIYNLFVKLGIENDPRSKERLEKILENAKKKYDKLEKDEKEYFDKEKLSNPYADTRFLAGDPNTEVKRMLVGVDIGVGELLLADRLSEKGTKIDLVMSHHPSGRGLVSIDEVMHVQADVLERYGVPINIAEGTLASRISEVSRTVYSANYNQVRDAANLLGLPFMCIHTAADNQVFQYISKLMEEKNPETVGDVVDIMKDIPEYKEGMKDSPVVRIYVGSPDRRAGKVAVTEMTGGTSGAKEIFEKMAHAGIGTIIGMHLSEEHRKEAEAHHLNVVIAGHMASDSIGLNLLLDEAEKKGVEIVPTAGLIRVKRF